jgi:hypothetical protein
MRWPTWLHRTGRPCVAEQAVAAQVPEQAAARQRVIDLAHPDKEPGWNAPTAMHRPLMTPGQAARGHGGRRP